MAAAKGSARYAPLSPEGSHGRFWRRTAGFAHAARIGDAADAGWVRVLKTRKSAVAAAALAAIAAALLAFWAVSGVAPQDAPAYLADQAGISHNNDDVSATVAYATYESTPDSTWRAGKRKQDMVLRLPAEVSTTDGNGREKTAPNPVRAAPSLWVDLDGDGKFAEGECVFNPPAYNADGTVKSPGKLMEAGKEVDSVELARTVPKGSYNARTVWTPVTEAGQPANPMTFDWKLRVR